jgi:hypothetical protein
LAAGLLLGLIGFCAALPEPARALPLLPAGMLADNAALPLQNVAGLPFAVEDVEGASGNDVPLAITLPSAEALRDQSADTGTFILVRNLPPNVGLSSGMSSGRVWVVPLREAETLKLTSGPEVAGRFTLEFNLIGPGNRVLAIDQVAVELRPAANTANTARKEAPQPAATAATQKQTVAISKEEEAKLLARGTQQIAEGAISEARLIFKWLAERGSGAAAFALAKTYDEAVVANSPTSGLTADMREARRWYERAAELENPEAQKRLSELR